MQKVVGSTSTSGTKMKNGKKQHQKNMEEHGRAQEQQENIRRGRKMKIRKSNEKNYTRWRPRYFLHLIATYKLTNLFTQYCL